MSDKEATVGLVVRLVSKSEKTKDVEEFLLKGYELVQDEPKTLEWFAVRYPTIENQYAIVDTFASDSGRNAHLDGPIATALKTNAPALLSDNPNILPIEVLASVLRTVDIKDLKVGLRVFVTAKEGKEQEVKQFLESAVPLVKEETFTPVWYAVALRGTPVFGIIDFFASEEDRKSHLNGKVAAALFANADTLLAKAPDVAEVDVLAWKVGDKKGSVASKL